MLDLHRHDEYSTFDGFGKALGLAKLAKDLGYTALGISNHGNTNGLVKHYNACKEVGIKPILGVEAYFKPKLDKERKNYHLCLFAINNTGYKNINKLMFIGEKQKYYKPIITFKNLKKYNDGIICTSACVGGFISQLILCGQNEIAIKAAKKFKEIFKDNFYIEVQPYSVDKDGTQEKVNIEIIKIAKLLNIKCILTSDSHYTVKEDFDTYLKMHEIAGTKYDVTETYGERYMPSYKEMGRRFIKMHKEDFSNASKMAKEMYKNLEEIEDKVDEDILGKLESKLPDFSHDKHSFEILKKKVKQGLKKRNKYSKNYIDRCEKELDIIKYHGYEDYFLMVADYVNWSKKHGIAVGPGRGSGCNSQVNYALGITDVDSLKFNLDFRRFLRKDKNKMPDIDLDFETERRQEVIDYLMKKYKRHAAQICSYGLYKVDNLINDLAKVSGLETTGKEIDEYVKNDNKQVVAAIKAHINTFIEDDELDEKSLINSRETAEYNRKYDNIIKHFTKLYKKVRFIGTHAAGVAITGGDIFDYTAIRIDKSGKYYTSYDLTDMETINVTKFDILGLRTMESIGITRKLTGIKEFNEDWIEDEEIIKGFNEGNTDGIFQFEKATAKDILRKIDCDCFEDVVAASSMNRPGPLSLDMPQQYAENKINAKEAKQSKYWDYTKKTYGTIIYQEQIQNICVNIGGMEWSDADVIVKMQKGGSKRQMDIFTKNYKAYKKSFIPAAIKSGLTKTEALNLYDNLFNYSFNEGHGTGYALISVEEMFYKLNYPTEYWYSKIKCAAKESDRWKYLLNAAQDGAIVFLPHVNYSADFELRKEGKDVVIQSGLKSIKHVGEKASSFIENERLKSGPYKSYDDFIERCKVKGSSVNKGIIEILKEQGALEFRKKIYIDRVIKYNSSLYMKGM